MPKFHLNTGSMADAQRYAELPAFTQGYIEAMFFTECEQGGNFDPENGSPLPEESGFADLAPETLREIENDCRKFMGTLPRDLSGRTDIDDACDYAPGDYDEKAAGRDFWYTRNGHGVGFWDRGFGDLCSPGTVGYRLSQHAKSFGECSVYLGDDERIYLM